MRLRRPPSRKGTGKIRGATGSAGSRISGVGGYRPERVVMNSELVEAIDSSTRTASCASSWPSSWPP